MSRLQAFAIRYSQSIRILSIVAVVAMSIVMRSYADPTPWG